MLDKIITYADSFKNCVTLTSFDDDHICIYANKKFYEQTGYSPEETIGKNLAFLQGPKTHPKGPEYLSKALKKGHACCQDIINYKKNGDEFLNRLVLLPVPDKEKPFIIGFQNDISNSEIANPNSETFKKVANGEIRHIINNQLASLFIKDKEQVLSEDIDSIIDTIDRFVLKLDEMQGFEDLSYESIERMRKAG